MPANHQIAYENIQTSHRSAEHLAILHGFESLNQFVESLPVGARVSDIGAGDSTLGLEVAKLRPDVTWTNIDYSYIEALPEYASKSPDNIEFVAYDATKLGDIIEPETQDVVLSYFMFPHLSLTSDVQASQVARAMFTATKPGGLISVGPDMTQMRSLPIGKWPPAFQVRKDKTVDESSFVNRVVTDTKAHGINRLNLLIASEVVAPTFGTSRYLKKVNDTPLVFDPKSGEYVKVLSVEGAMLTGRLVGPASKLTVKFAKERTPIGVKAAVAVGTIATGAAVAHRLSIKSTTKR